MTPPRSRAPSAGLRGGPRLLRYRRVNALLRLRGTRVSKRVRRVMREGGSVAARPRRRRYSSYAAGEPDGRPANPEGARRGGCDALLRGRPGELAVTDVSSSPRPAASTYLEP